MPQALYPESNSAPRRFAKGDLSNPGTEASNHVETLLLPSIDLGLVSLEYYIVHHIKFRTLA